MLHYITHHGGRRSASKKRFIPARYGNTGSFSPRAKRDEVLTKDLRN
jgi:hypothetical protein